jgi:Tol biopolymer transport system component
VSAIRCHLLVAALRSTLVLSSLAPIACRPTSPPPREILFQRQPPGDTEDLWAINFSTGQARRLTRGQAGSANSLAAWAPDGRRIAFIREFEDHDELYVTDSVDALPRRLFPQGPALSVFPDWSPDGRRLLVSAGPDLNHLDVVLVEVDGSGTQVVLADTANHRCPTWAPDGQRFVVGANTSRQSSLIEASIHGQITKVLLSSDSTILDCPQWSPDGRSILYTVVHRGLEYLPRAGQEILADLHILDLATGASRGITSGPGMNNYGRWVRDSRWIVFQSDRHASPFTDTLALAHFLDSLEIYVIRADGSALRRITTNTYFDAHPSW